ncbi:unnamed protein product, partial [Ixodes pacificus]
GSCCLVLCTCGVVARLLPVQREKFRRCVAAVAAWPGSPARSVRWGTWINSAHSILGMLGCPKRGACKSFSAEPPKPVRAARAICTRVFEARACVVRRSAPPAGAGTPPGEGRLRVEGRPDAGGLPQALRQPVLFGTAHS